MNLRAVNDQVIVVMDTGSDTTSSGLHLPSSAIKTEQTGTVVHVGPGAVLYSGIRGAMDVKVGDRVMCTRYGGEVVEFEPGKPVSIYTVDQILALIED